MTDPTALAQRPADYLLAPTTLKEAVEYAEYISKSGIIPKAYQGKAPDVLVAVQYGRELGLPPLQSLQSIAVINGTPSVWGDALIGIVRASKLCEWIEETFDESTMTATCTAQRRGEQPQARSFSRKDAEQAKLWGKRGGGGQDTPWITYPKRMLAMRARGFCLRDLFPDVLRGIAVREEVEDYRDMGPAERLPTEPPASRAQSVKQRLQTQRSPAGKEKPPAGNAAVPTSGASNAAEKITTSALPEVDDLAERINQARTLNALEALGHAVADFPRGSEDRKALVALLKARKQALAEHQEFVKDLDAAEGEQPEPPA